MPIDRPIVLSVAGFDPCGGAGVLADVKTFEQLKTQGMAVITANTTQTEDAIAAIEWQDTGSIRRSIQCLMKRYPIAVVKIGIVNGLKMLKAIVEEVRSHHPQAQLIWDPVLTSSSGFSFFNHDDLAGASDVLGDVDLITPNSREYEWLRGWMTKERAILVTGGHREQEVGLDVLKYGGEEHRLFPNTGPVYPKHGSGCVLSAAIAAHVALGYDLAMSCRLAKQYIEKFLASHAGLLGYHRDNEE